MTRFRQIRSPMKPQTETTMMYVLGSFGITLTSACANVDVTR